MSEAPRRPAPRTDRGRPVPASSARSASRSARPSRRMAMLSSPPSGEVSSAWASSASSVRPRAATCRREQQRADRRVGGQRDLVAGHLDRDAGGHQRAAETGDRRAARRGPARPSPSTAARRAGGRCAGSRRCARPRRPALVQVNDLHPAPGQRRVAASGCRNGAEHVRRQRPRQSAAGRRRCGWRPAACCRTAGSDPGRAPAPESPSTVRNRSGKSRIPRASAPRKRVDRLVRIADRDHVAAVAGDGLQQPDLGRVGVLVLVDEDRRRSRARSVATTSGSVSRIRHRCTSSA